jgi:enoyl-CoA hydratase/carnithine racemase
MSAAPVLSEVRDGVLLVTLNRPEVRNSLNLALIGGLCEALEQLDSDPALSAAVLTGAGKGFCAGMDLAAFLAGENVWEGAGDGRGLRRVVAEPTAKPLIAAIEGFAVAGGLEVALACDVIVCGRSAKLGVPEVSRSLVAAGGALRQLPRRVGPGLAKKLALTGELIDGERGAGIGLVDELTDDGAAVAAALALAARIALAGPLAVRATKRVLDLQADLTDDEFWGTQQSITDPVFASEDAAEGSRAFTEKRAPVWRGR